MTIAGLFPDGPGADSFTEKIFKGPLHIMLQDALSHIHSMVIEEKVVKHPDRPEADRFFNYPFPAIEEALCNAVYHRSYEIREPVEVGFCRIPLLSAVFRDRTVLFAIKTCGHSVFFRAVIAIDGLVSF